MKLTVIRHSIRNRGGDRLILDYLSYLAEQGHEIIYWTNEVNTSFVIHPRIQIKKIPFPGISGTIRFTLFTKFNTDVLLVDLAVMALFASLKNHAKIIYLAQDDDRAYYASKLSRFLMEQVFRVTLSCLKIPVIAVSAHLADQLKKFSKGDLFTISNGVDQKIFFHDTASRFIQERSTKTVITLFARSDFRKGLDVGVKAIKTLAHKIGVTDWELWVIGNDPAQINIPGLKIKRLGFLDDEGLRAVFSAADIYLLPSRHEGLSLLLLAALSCRCAVVSTTAGNILTDNVNALVSPIEDGVALANNMDRLINDDPLKERLRQEGASLAREFSFQKSAKEFEAILLNKKAQG
jgi:glycosyltransferase involved in cell wall biosynthesis